MYGKYLLAANAVGDAAHGDGLVDAAMLLGNDGALESLGTLTVALLDAHSHTHRVAHAHRRQLGLHVLLGQGFDEIHKKSFLYQTFIPED